VKILISADMEGATGVTWPADVEPGTERQRCRAFIGYHAGAGAEGVLAHTYLPNSITSVQVNGESASEGWLNARVAEQYGVPVILITGDDLTCSDASGYAPVAQTVAVKKCITEADYG